MKQGGVLLFGLLALLAMTPSVHSEPVAELFHTYYGVAVQGSEDSEHEFAGLHDLMGCGGGPNHYEIVLELYTGTAGDELVLTAPTEDAEDGSDEALHATARLGEPASIQVTTWRCFPDWTVTGAVVDHAAAYRVSPFYLD